MNSNLKGIILAAGKGTRLMPATLSASKPLLPLYDKPMIYYPLETLIRLGIKDILFIVQEEDLKIFKNIFGTGDQLGLNFSYLVQPIQRGISDAYLIAENFVKGSSSVLALCDNLFIGKDYFYHVNQALKKMQESGSCVFGLEVPDPEKFAVVEFDKQGKVVGVEEKPTRPKTNTIIPGLFFFDSKSTEFAKNIKPSNRGELEICDLYLQYLKIAQFSIEMLDKSIQWFDAGSADSLLEASNALKKYSQSSKNYLGYYEIASYEMKFSSKEQLQKVGNSLKSSQYGQNILSYLANI
jgi:glucose-1-phosphate thymidylyltransferase